MQGHKIRQPPDVWQAPGQNSLEKLVLDEPGRSTFISGRLRLCFGTVLEGWGKTPLSNSAKAATLITSALRHLQSSRIEGRPSHTGSLATTARSHTYTANTTYFMLRNVIFFGSHTRINGRRLNGQLYTQVGIRASDCVLAINKVIIEIRIIQFRRCLYKQTVQSQVRPEHAALSKR